MNNPLFDTGVVYATLDRRDAWHARSVDLVASLAISPRLPVTILAEVCYLARTKLGAHVERIFVADLSAGNYAVENLQEGDIDRADELMRTYGTLGFVDASVIAVAERLRVDTIATTDRRDFSIVRPMHVDRFTLVP